MGVRIQIYGREAKGHREINETKLRQRETLE